MWSASVGDYHFIITHDDGEHMRPEDHAEWKGFKASWKSYEGRHAPAVKIDGKWDALEQVEAACEETWRMLRANN